jgi:pyruvate dehydrogenase E2 component (dihydrolipoamide acetyltransferase)
MKETITMPVLSDTMTTGRLLRWLKQPGDPVKKGESVAEIESDKAIMDVEVYRDGYLEGPLAPIDTDIPVKQPIGYVVDRPGEAAAPPPPVMKPEKPETAPGKAPSRPEVAKPVAPAKAAAPAAEAPTAERKPATAPKPAPEKKPAAPAPPAVSAPAQPAPARPTERPLASPYARALAQDLGVEIGQVAPGVDGQIHAAEVLAAALRGPQPDLEAGPPYRIVRPSAMQEAVARNMAATVDTPTFRISTRISLHALQNVAKEKQRSLTLLLARACALSIRKHPRLNAAHTANGLALRDRVDIGIAVDLGEGLVTPVLRDAAERPLNELAEDWRILHDKAERQRLTPSDYRGATFYVSNLGVFPNVHQFDTLVPLGAAAILAVAAMISESASFTLSCDHRVVFGAEAARFLATLKDFVEKPEAWC